MRGRAASYVLGWKCIKLSSVSPGNTPIPAWRVSYGNSETLVRCQRKYISRRDIGPLAVSQPVLYIYSIIVYVLHIRMFIMFILYTQKGCPKGSVCMVQSAQSASMNLCHACSPGQGFRFVQIFKPTLRIRYAVHNSLQLHRHSSPKNEKCKKKITPLPACSLLRLLKWDSNRLLAACNVSWSPCY